MNKRLTEILRFICTGGLCTVIEYAVLYLLKTQLHMAAVPASALGFLVSVIVNYVMCVFWVFPGAKEGSRRAQIGFVVTSLMGLALNSIIMWALTALFGEDTVLLTVFGFDLAVYMVNKVIATGLVMVFNYFSKRFVLKGSV